jgi:undecaprenyl-diphosphatase
MPLAKGREQMLPAFCMPYNTHMSHYIPARIRHDPLWHVWGLATGLVFAVLLMLARLYPASLDAVDAYVEGRVVPLQSFSFIEPFLVVTVLGSVVGIGLVALLAAYLLQANRFAVLQLILLMLFTSVSMGIAKTFVERARPETLMWLDPMNSYSFPSGHATLATALYGFIAVCLYRRIRSRIARWLSVGLCILTVLLVCLSRLVLNYHYLTDVAAGTLLGLFWLSVVLMLPKR